jgi:hypothetical protein
LNPHDEQRHTACMRYISAPHRSHSILSSALVVPGPAGSLRGVRGRGGCTGSGMRPIISNAHAPLEP